MGISVSGDPAFDKKTNDVITKFYTPSAWIDDRAELQLTQLASWAGIIKIAAFPDLHPGKYGPVGCAILADRLYPQFIGNDIGCGMSMFLLDLPARKFKLDKAVRRIRVLGDASSVNYGHRLSECGLPDSLFADALGTIGGGNHFCELQSVAHCKDSRLDAGAMYLLVHSGSRGFGSSILNGLDDTAFEGLSATSDAGQKYISLHNQAVLWASLNRRIIAERAAEALRAELQLVVDAPHNQLSKYDGAWLHRKGAANASSDLVPLAGSRATASYLMKPLEKSGAMQSMAHGSGRRYDRSSMHGRVGSSKSELDAMQRNSFGGRLLCEDKNLLIEESPKAYKSSKSVVEDLQSTGVATEVAELIPLLTFKKTRAEGRI